MSAAKEILYLAIIVGVICSVFGIPIYQYTHVWNETGIVSWVGGKIFDTTNSKFATVFAVTVSVHGTFNFTDTGVMTLCGNASWYSGMGSPSKGTAVELIKLQCGGYDLVVDP